MVHLSNELTKLETEQKQTNNEPTNNEQPTECHIMYF